MIALFRVRATVREHDQLTSQAKLLGYLLYWVLPKDNMPQIFKNASTCGIVERCVVQPPQGTDVELQGPLVHLVSRHREMSTAWSAYHLWYAIVFEYLIPCIPECVFCAPTLSMFLAERLILVWISRDGDASEIGIAVA